MTGEGHSLLFPYYNESVKQREENRYHPIKYYKRERPQVNSIGYSNNIS